MPHPPMGPSRSTTVADPVSVADAEAAAGGGVVFALHGVAVEVERTPVLRGLDLVARPGEVLGVSGANGAGKSTLLRVLATLLVPAAGTGRVLGAALGSPGCAGVRSRIGLIGHLPGLYPQLTLRENLQFTARLSGRSSRVADEALDVVGLARAADRRAGRCSQGMQRRAELARVWCTAPLLLLLDEAHAGLDRTAVGLVDVLVGQVTARGGACVLVSHDRERLLAATHRMVDIVDGRAVAGPDTPDPGLTDLGAGGR